MLIEKYQRDKLLKILNKLKNKGFLRKLKKFFAYLIPYSVDENGDILWCDVIIKLALFLFAIISFISPYYMLVVYIKFSYPFYLIFLSSVASLFFMISIIGVLGRGMIGCLTYPSNWFFLMFCSDFMTILCNCYSFYYLQKHDDLKKENDYVFVGSYAIIGNNLFILAFFIQHYKVYKLINKIYSFIIFLELKCIYIGSHQICNCQIYNN